MNKDDRKVLDFHLIKILHLEEEIKKNLEIIAHHRNAINDWVFPDKEVEE